MSNPSTPLTALCNICHGAAPKYTCPRDKVRTCSLACSQAHKRRAACSGIRDPSAYVSKSTLATPGGIDRDYNFLSGLERNIDRADKETTERGVSLSGQGKPIFQKRWHDHGALSKYLREHGIMVHKAPIGMARQKANQTRFIQKSKRIVWSVEWIVEGEKRVAEVDESRTIQEAYKELLSEKEREKKKRKRAPEDVSAKAQKQKVQSTDTQQEQEPGISEGQETTSEGKGEATATDKSAAALATDESKTEVILENQQSSPTEEKAAAITTAQFYLHKPHTSSPNTVLIPINSHVTLTEALGQKDLLEFPTIYVFSVCKPSQAQDDSNETTPVVHLANRMGENIHELPTGFITLDQYKQERSTEDDELIGLMELIPEGQRKAVLDGDILGASSEDREQVDEKQILEVLQKDANALRQ